MRIERVALALLLSLACVPAQAAGKRKVRIGLVGDGPWERGVQIVGIFEEEILALLSNEFDVSMPADKRLIADFTRAQVEFGLETLVADPEVDMILAAGLIASSLAVTRPTLPKPVVAAYVIDGPLQGAPMTDEGTSGRKNLCYIQTPDALERDLKMFLELTGFSKLALLGPSSLFVGVPSARESALRFGPKLGFESTLIGVGNSAAEALAAIPADADAVYIAPLLEMSEDELDVLIAGVNAKKLPSFSFWGRPEVERGVLATGTSEPDTRRRARRVALNIQRILLGEDAGTFNVNFPRGEALLLNIGTSRAIGFSPSWRVMTDAELINIERKDTGTIISLESVLSDVVKANLQLAANAQAVEAQRSEIERAWAPLLPQLTASARGTIIDSDRAAASFGSAPERSLWVGGELKQVLFAERAWANLTIQERLHGAKEHEREALVLDVQLAGAQAYFNVLRAMTFERIQRENLKKTRANLEMARIREKVGSAGPSEVLRWRSQIANDRKSVLQSVAQRNVAEIALNQLLHRGLEEPFEPADVEAKTVMARIAPLTKSLDNPRSFKLYRRFMVRYGLGHAPELSQLREVTGAIERNLDSLNRLYWLPTLAFIGQLDHRLLEGGEGTEGLMLELPPGVTAPELPRADATNWSMTVAMSFPLFVGFERNADITKAQRELSQRSIEHRLIAERVEQRIRSTLHVAGASLPSIQLADESLAAAAQNLEVVTDAYSRGAVDILVLLDAQNAALITEQVAASAVYDHLINLMNVSRAVGCFDFLYDQRSFDEFHASFDEFLQAEVGR